MNEYLVRAGNLVGIKLRLYAQNTVAMFAAVSFVLVVAVWMVFGQTLHHKFVNLDDNLTVCDNSHITTGFSLTSIGWAFTHVDANFYSPLLTISHMLDWQIYGGDAGGHHLTNILLHTATVIVFFLTWRQMNLSWSASAFIAGVFAIHPLHVESVAWISERKDTLSGFFFALSLLTYAHYVRRPESLRRYGAVLFVFACGLLSKPSLITTPLVLLLLDYWPLRRFSRANDPSSGRMRIGQLRPLLGEKIPFAALSAVAAVVALFAQGNAVMSTDKYPVWSRIGNALVSYVVYIEQTLWPICLAPFYPDPVSKLRLSQIVFAFAFLAAVSFAVFALRKRYPAFLTGWCWYLLMLLPMIGIVQVGQHAHADRFMYLPQIGLCFVVTSAASEFLRRQPALRNYFASIALMGLIALAALANRQTSYWQDSFALWNHTLRCTADNYLAHNNLGVALWQKGNVEGAMDHYESALAIRPDYAAAHCNLAKALRATGQIDDAIFHYRKALEADPNVAEVHNDLGNAFRAIGDLEDAIRQYRKAIELKPANFFFQTNLAFVLATSPSSSLRNGPEAVSLAERANRASHASDPLILGTLAAAYAECGRFVDAVQIQEKALQAANVRGQNKLAEALQSDLQLYRTNAPLRLPSAPSTFESIFQ